jgi:uncharacterized damage-inducible protein DinB
MKKMNLRFLFLLLVICTGITQAQNDKPAPHRTTSQVLDIWVTDTETHLVPLADALPEDKYSFAPTNGEFKGVRTFAEQMKHLASFNYLAANFILGKTPTQDQKEETGPESVKTKAEVMEYLKGSFALLHQAVASIDDKNLIKALPGASKGRIELALETRLALVIDALSHSFNHYGQLVEYLRMNGIVPPASR